MESNKIPGLTVEEIRALFFDAGALREPDYKVYQLNHDGHRYYYRFVDGEPVFYPSVTTLLKQVMPTPLELIKWMVANGESAAEKRDLAAAYGTYMHIQFERLIISRKYNFDEAGQALSEYMKANGIPDAIFTEWLVKIRKDVLAFAQFIKDYDVKPLAIEIGLVHPELKYAGCIDLPCVMTDPKTGEAFPAIVDFKSGRKGFYEEHELQLHLYRAMWNFNFPDKPVERVFNFSPKDWRTKPTYNLKDQTNAKSAEKLPHLLALAAIADAERDNILTIVRGTLDLDGGSVLDNVLSISLSDLVKGKADTKQAPKPAKKGQNANKPEKAPKTPVNEPEPFGVINPIPAPIEANTDEITEKLPWEDEQSPVAPVAAPVPLGNPTDSAEKENLLQTEIDF